MVKVKPPRARAPAAIRTSRRGGLNSQVKEIHCLIRELRQREEPSALGERARSAVRTGRDRATRLAPAERRAAIGASPSAAPLPRQADVDAAAAAIEARLLPICERLDATLGELEARLGAASPETVSALSPGCTLRGRISESLLPDLLQLVTSNRWTGCFIVRDGGTECRLYFDEGDSCHAESPGAVGEGAFFAALALERGEYEFIEMTEMPEKTINSNTQFLILEALRQIDEAKT